MAPKKKGESEPKVLLGRPKGNLKIGLVGLPNVGKSTTFNLLAKQSVAAENYPFCTIDPHEARVNVADDKFQWLCKHFNPKSEVPPSLTVYDIAGLVPGAHKGEGLGNAFLSHIQSVDGIYHVVRVFEDADIVHTEGEVNPVADLETIHKELLLKDLDRISKMREDFKKLRQCDKAKKMEMEIVENIYNHLEKGEWISKGSWKAADIDVLNSLQLLTAKPVVYLLNLSESSYAKRKNKHLSKIYSWVQEHNPGPMIPYSAKFEIGLSLCTTEESKKAYCKEHGVEESAIDKIIHTGYSTLQLIHFYTVGPDEVKCWTIRNGTKAPQAAGVIHTDFEKGFICADVYKFEDLVAYKSEVALKSAGKIAQKGKDYVVEEGDIIFFKFNPTGGGSKK